MAKNWVDEAIEKIADNDVRSLMAVCRKYMVDTAVANLAKYISGKEAEVNKLEGLVQVLEGRT